MRDEIDKLARDQFDFVELPETLQQEQQRLIEKLLTLPLTEGFKDLQTYEKNVRAELARRVHESRHRQARIGLNLHMASVVHCAGLREICLKYFGMAQKLAVKAMLIQHASDISVLQNVYTRTPYYSAEVAQACQGLVDREDILEIAAMKLDEDPLGAALGILAVHGVTGRRELFKSKGLIID